MPNSRTHLPPNREIKRLGDKKIFTLIMGQSPKSDTYNKKQEGLPFFQGKKEFGKISPIPGQRCSNPLKIAEPGDILLSVRAPVGPTNIADQICCIGRGLSAIRVNTKYGLNVYIGYFFKKFQQEISSLGKGSTFNAITKKDLDNLSIPLPPLSEQKKIVAKLDEISHSIQTSQAEIRSQLSALDKLWESTLHQAFDNEEWEKVKLKEIVDNYDGRRIPIKSSERKKSKGGKYPYYGATGIIDHVDEYIFDGSFLLISEDGANLVARKYPIAFIAKGKFRVNNHAHIIKGKQGILHDIFLKYFIDSTDILQYITGSAQPKLSQKMMNKIQLPLPPLSEQKKIVTYLDQVNEKITKLKTEYTAQLDHYDQLRASILDQAFKGEL